jgi:hypothetical protein
MGGYGSVTVGPGERLMGGTAGARVQKVLGLQDRGNDCGVVLVFDRQDRARALADVGDEFGAGTWPPKHWGALGITSAEL